MKNNILEYKGYHTKIDFDSEDCVLRGKIEGISDLIVFECEELKSVEKEFHEAVDDYLDFCKEMGKEAEKEYKGSFNVRIHPDLHKALANFAIKNGDTLNSTVEKAIQKYIFGELEKGQSIPNANESIWPSNIGSSLQSNKQLVYNSNVIQFNDGLNFPKEMTN